MQTTIDKAGRLVIPKRLRDQVGLAPGTAVELSVDGAALRLEPVAVEGFEREGDLLVIPRSGRPVTDEQVREMRLADQA